MRFKTASVLALGSMALMAACAQTPPVGQAYWQRVDADSALYMTGPKAQQRLNDDIATCVHEVDELVELDAVREALPPDTYSDYRNALDASGDLAYYDTPTRFGDKKVAHADFHDYEGCMRYKGWERVRYVRYTTLAKANKTYTEAHQYWKTGLMGPAAEAANQAALANVNNDYANLNK
ncbi:MAG: hypothetical protein KGQ70_06945 [Alphaproteobacteria bacterium]|nr:hypothetical protein [Alphaproteobacteria bacterium]